MNIYYTILFGLVFLDYSSRYDGGEDGGSIDGLLKSIGAMWWPIVGIFLLFLVIKSFFTNIFVDKPRQREHIKKFHSDHPTLQDKQNHYDDKFRKEKLEIEKDWKKLREDYLPINGVFKPFSYDITNRAKYAKQIARYVVKEDYSSEQGFKLLSEYWTYDGEWRQGYWDGNFDYSDKRWEENTKCDFLNTRMGDIQPKINKPPITPTSITETKKEENSKIDFNAIVSSEDDDLPF